MKAPILFLLFPALLLGCSHAKDATPSPPCLLPYAQQTLKVDSNGVIVTIKADVPSHAAALQRGLASYVAAQLFCNEADGEPADTASAASPGYDGDLCSFLQACALAKWQELDKLTFDDPGSFGDAEAAAADERISPAEARQQAARMAATDSIYSSTHEITLTLTYADDSLASWQYNYYIYLANSAHPSIGTSGITLRRDSGTPLTHSDLLDAAPSPALRQQLKEVLRQWIAAEWEIPADDDEQLQNCLSPPDSLDVNALPLPQQPPFLTSGGIALPYREGELLPEGCVLVLPLR